MKNRSKRQKAIVQGQMDYMKAKQKRVALNWLRSDYETRIEPAIKKSGLPVSTFIKMAVVEKLERDGLMGIEKEA